MSQYVQVFCVRYKSCKYVSGCNLVFSIPHWALSSGQEGQSLFMGSTPSAGQVVVNQPLLCRKWFKRIGNKILTKINLFPLSMDIKIPKYKCKSELSNVFLWMVLINKVIKLWGHIFTWYSEAIDTYDLLTSNVGQHYITYLKRFFPRMKCFCTWDFMSTAVGSTS